MRELTPDELAKVQQKLKFFIGDNYILLIKDKSLMLHNKRVLLINTYILKHTSNIPKLDMVYCGTVIGKFTKNENFRISISSVHVLSQYAVNKVWIKKSAEMNFVYGNNALKSHVHRMSDSVPLNSGVFVYNQNDVCLGYGVSAIRPDKYADSKGYQLVVIRQGDTGEYIRNEQLIG